MTEYTLYTPLPLPTRTTAPSHAPTAPTLSNAADPTVDSSLPEEVMDTLMRSTRWDEVKERLRQYRHLLRQRDGLQGDLGVADGLDDGLALASSKEQRRAQRQRKHQKRMHTKAASGSKHARFADADTDGDIGQMAIGSGDGDGNTDDEGFDLALPPPALDLPEEYVRQASPSSSRHRSEKHRHHSSRASVDLSATFESERATGWRMSDVPLTPRPFSGASKDAPHRSRSRRTKVQGVPLQAAYESDAEQDASPPQPESETTPSSSPPKAIGPAWWLDISCPTYRDMVELSKLFPLHPLTVEDILQQESREKVEIFQKLGYYFANIRAVDERYYKFSADASTGEAARGEKPGPSSASPKSNASTQIGSSSPSREKIVGGPKDNVTSVEPNSPDVESLEMQVMNDKCQQNEKWGSKRDDDGQPHHGKGRVTLMEGVGGKEGLEGLSVGACNLYLVVFSHGVITFHTEDVSGHIDRVRRRMLDPSQPIQFTSDWIFHGLFDSIVDTFIPLVDYVEAEVTEIEAATSEEKTMFDKIRENAAKTKGIGSTKPEASTEAGPFPSTVFETKERMERFSFRPIPWIYVSRGVAELLPRMLIRSQWIIASPPDQADRRRRFLRKGGKPDAHLEGVSAAAQTAMLRRISDNRKIITGLQRLLLPKHDTVRAVRKRLAEIRSLPSTLSERGKASGGGAWAGVAEVSVHMGDVGDHVVTLFTLLHSGEGRLSETHQKYLVSVRINNRRSRLKSDNALVTLASVTVTALACTCWLSTFGMNIHVPKNDPDSNNFSALAGVLSGLAAIPVLIAVHVWYLKRSVRRKWEARRKAR